MSQNWIGSDLEETPLQIDPAGVRFLVVGGSPLTTQIVARLPAGAAEAFHPLCRVVDGNGEDIAIGRSSIDGQLSVIKQKSLPRAAVVESLKHHINVNFSVRELSTDLVQYTGHVPGVPEVRIRKDLLHYSPSVPAHNAWAPSDEDEFDTALEHLRQRWIADNALLKDYDSLPLVILL